MSYITDIRKKVGHDPVFMPFSACVIIRNNKMLLQKRMDDGTWAFHGGCLEFGETFREALDRELEEELHIKALNPQIINICSGKEMYHVYPNGDKTYPIGVLYLVTSYRGKIVPDLNEVSEVCWFPLDSLPENILNSDKIFIPDVLLFYKEYQRKRKKK